MGWKEEAAAYFHFTKKDRVAILVLVVLIILIWIFPRWVAAGAEANPVVDTSWVAEIRRLEQPPSLETTGEGEEHGANYRFDRPVAPRQKGELFFFDPNTLAKEGWERLGLRPKTTGTILNFVAKGGRFRNPGDLKKIYGLFPDEYERLAPFVRISAQEDSGSENVPVQEFVKTGPEPKKRYSNIDINTADSLAFVDLPGIGTKLAARIISFREKLGGFYSVEQVGEVFGLADSVFQKIRPLLKVETLTLRKININKATVEELKAHPYIRYQLANPMAAYRKEHGAFRSVEEMKKLGVITEELYDRLLPYITVE